MNIYNPKRDIIKLNKYYKPKRKITETLIILFFYGVALFMFIHLILFIVK
jgi:hypothetical protein